MFKGFVVVLLLLASCFGQNSGQYSGGGGSVTSGSGAPAGSCQSTSLYVNSANGNLYTCNGGSWSAVSSSVTYPLTAPLGSASAPSYSFSGDTTTGCFDIANQMTCKSSSGIFQLSGLATDTGAGIIELYLTPDNTTTQDGVIQMNGVSNHHYRIVVKGSGITAGLSAGDFAIEDQNQASKFAITNANNNVLFPGLTSSTAVTYLLNGGTLGTDDGKVWIGPSAGETISSQSFSSGFHFTADKTGVNSGNIIFNNTCFIDNTTNNSGRLSLGCSVPVNGGLSASFGAYTNDGAPFSGSGLIFMNPDDSGGFGRIEADNTTGFRFSINNNTQATNYGLMQVTSGDWNILSKTGTVTLAPNNANAWRAKTTGELSGLIAGHGTQQPASVFSSLPSCVAGLEGLQAGVTDSTTTTFHATITGTGTNHVLAYCNGTNWVVGG